MQEYINNKSTEGTNSHSGLALATECVLSFAALNSTSDSLAQPYLATRSLVLGSLVFGPFFKILGTLRSCDPFVLGDYFNLVIAAILLVLLVSLVLLVLLILLVLDIGDMIHGSPPNPACPGPPV